ncbi:MAG: pectate lyase [Verrucomicrobiia bacterium]
MAKDPSAPPLWARFYEIKSNRPFFCDRDGVVKYEVEEIGGERRKGYSWYSNTGEKVAKAYNSLLAGGPQMHHGWPVPVTAWTRTSPIL